MTDNDRLKSRMRDLEKRCSNLEARYELLIAFVVAETIEDISGEKNERKPPVDKPE